MTPARRAVTLGAAMAVLAIACGGRERPEGPVETTPGTTARAEAPTEESAPPEADAPEGEPTCMDFVGDLETRLAQAIDSHAECLYDTDCAALGTPDNCRAPCDVALHPRGVPTFRELSTPLAGYIATCPAAVCPQETVECARSTPRCAEGRCMMDDGDAPLREMPVPAENARSLSDNPPPRPAPGAAEQERGQRLFDAIVHDDPARIGDFFFPREAFAVVKAIADPDGYWQRLFRRFSRDMHELHATLVEEHGDLSGLPFARLDIIRRGGWVPLREEGNALPYWVSRHSQLYYTVGQEEAEERHFEVRVLITWGERWYVTHLKEFH
ncbi:MAG: hypothetical protein JRH11_02850 [Deltaproteobacteria bacterium]|nr:hypothetical protein [Deltaproteobacteria bacterium]